MSSDVNVCIMSGFLDSDPKVSQTKNNSQAVSLSLASTRQITIENDSRVMTSWFNIAAYNQSVVELFSKMSKGQPVLVQGSLNVRSWMDQETNQKKLRYEIIADKVKIIETMQDEVNVCVMSGVLEADPRVMVTKHGTQAVSFSLAVSKQIAVDGEIRNMTSWFKVASYDQTVVDACSGKKKGDCLVVHGTLTVRSWVDQQTNQKKLTYELVADKVFSSDAKTYDNASANSQPVESELDDDIFG